MVSQRTRRFGEGQREGMMGQVAEAAQHPKQFLQDYPISTSFVCFGLGIGVGIVLAQALCEPISRAMHEPTMTERLGRSVQDVLHEYMPEMSRRMGV
jgi:hypothetical protein